MNTKLIVGMVITIIILGGGYFLFFWPSAVTLQLNVQNDSGESGTAELSEKDGKVVVSLLLAGAPEGVTQPAHIHVGSCPNVGAVKYPLTFPINGKSETTLNVSLADLRAGLPLAINVHKSAAEAKTYVACGDISL